MKKLFIIIISLVVISSCSTTKEAQPSNAELRKVKKATEQLLVKNAVESRRYIIKLSRVFFSHGGMGELIPRANFIIIDGEKAIISTAYLGRQSDIKPIVGINMKGRAVDYAVTDNLSQGSYKIQMKVKNGRGNSFDLYLSVSKNGYCDASISSLKIDNIRYSGYLVPISDVEKPISQEGDMI
jgi:hypothetical protein